jgi:tetratricopeptide (TPR) repeat protein
MATDHRANSQFLQDSPPFSFPEEESLMLRTMKFNFRAAICLIMVYAGAGLSHAQDTVQVTTARRLIETERKTIFLAMHPTAKLTTIDYVGSARSKGGFELTYTFKFKGIGGDYASKMAFQFNARGGFAGIETVSTTSWVEPFFAADLALGLLKDMVKDDFAMKKDGLIAKALDAADAKLVVELMLTYKQSQLRPDAGAAKDDELLKLIRATESMNDRERQEWIDLLPRMTTDERAKLRKILVDERDALADIDRRYEKEFKAFDSVRNELDEGYRLLVGKDYAGAIKILSKVLRNDPKNEHALFIRGQAYDGQKEFKAAVTDFSTVIEHNPKAAASYRRRAWSYWGLKNYQAAYLDYRRSAELDPKSPLAANGMAWFLATCPDRLSRNGDEAVVHARKACELTKWQEPLYFDTLAAAYAEAGDFDKAVEWQNKALADPAALEKEIGRDEFEQARRRLTLFKENKPFREIR